MYRVLSFSALSIAVKFVIGFILTKLFAVFLGPSGIATLGNLKNTMQVISSCVGLGMERGVIRFTSELKNQPHEFKKFIGTSQVIYAISTLTCAVFFYVFSTEIASYVLLDDKNAYIIKILAFVVPLQGFHFLFFSILQGIGNYKKVVWVELIMSISNLVFTGSVVFLYGLSGVLIATVCVPLVYFVASSSFLMSKSFLFKFRWSTEVAKNLAVYAIMTIFSGLAFPLLHILIRNMTVETLGLDSAGYWEAVNQLSYFSFMFLNSVILMYVLPRITANSSVLYYRNQVVDYLTKLMPFFLFFLLILFSFRNLIISLLFSDDFKAVELLLGWQLAGDFFRALTLVFTVYFHARRMVLAYVLIDVILFCALLFFSFFLLHDSGLIGLVKAHFLSFFIYFLITVFWLRKPLFHNYMIENE